MDGNQVRLLSCGFLPPSSTCAGVFPGFPGRFCHPPGFLCLLVLLLRIRGFLYLNLWECCAASACVIFSCLFQFSETTSGQDASPSVLNSGFVHTLPKVQASTDSFSWGHDPFTLACKARPSFDGCGTSLSVSLSLSLSLAIAAFLESSQFNKGGRGASRESHQRWDRNDHKLLGRIQIAGKDYVELSED